MAGTKFSKWNTVVGMNAETKQEMSPESLTHVMLFSSAGLVEVKEVLNYIKNNNLPRKEQIDYCESGLQSLQSVVNTLDRLQRNYDEMAESIRPSTMR